MQVASNWNEVRVCRACRDYKAMTRDEIYLNRSEGSLKGNTNYDDGRRLHFGLVGFCLGPTGHQVFRSTDIKLIILFQLKRRREGGREREGLSRIPDVNAGRHS